MGREKKSGFLATASAKDRHKRDKRADYIDWKAPLPAGLRARRDFPRTRSKHKTVLEFVENEKKKALETQTTEDQEPPPGFEFVPIGNPDMTKACKDISREQGAMIFIVTSSVGGQHTMDLSLQLNRIGYHVRQSIVQQARERLGNVDQPLHPADIGKPEPIPERQEDINAQADAAIRDLFPRIPHPDRQMIIAHAFNKAHKDDKKTVGLAERLPLSRRVQMAVLAHIRHQHTNYDAIIKEYDWATARKAAHPVCLEYLVKWRGDEENGRDRAEEILRELVIISDSESDSDSDEEEDDGGYEDTDDEEDANGVSPGSGSSTQSPPIAEPEGTQQIAVQQYPVVGDNYARGNGFEAMLHAAAKTRALPRLSRQPGNNGIQKNRKERRGFSRYEAVRAAVEQGRLDLGTLSPPSIPAPADGSTSHRLLTLQPARPDPVFGEARPLTEPMSLVSLAPSHPPERAIVQDICYDGWERDRLNTRPHHMAQSENYLYSNESRGPPSNGYQPIVRPLPVVSTQFERVNYHGQDLKDHLVPSIEPISPERARCQGQVHPEERFPQPILINQTAAEGRFGPSRYVQHGLAHDSPYGGPPSMNDEYRWDQPTRQDLRPALAPGHPRELRSVMISRSRDVERDDLPRNSPNGHARRSPPPGYGNTIVRNDRSVLVSEYEPSWAEDGEAPLRSRARPISVRDEPEPFERVTVLGARPGYEAHSIPTQGSGMANGYPTNPNYGADNSSHDRYSAFPHYKSVEIVHVTNKFPRRHEPPPISAEMEYYDLSRPQPRVERVERVVGRVKEAVRRPEPLGVVFPREERVVMRDAPIANHIHDDQRYAQGAMGGEAFRYIQRLPASISSEPISSSEYRRSTVYLD